MATSTAFPYRIQIEPVEGRVTAYAGEQVLAASDHAKVMRETRLPPVVYFPKEDVQSLGSEPSTKRTFCPFKGTATYWSVRLPDCTVTDGAWSYETALDEAHDIEGHVAFYAKVADRFEGPDGFLDQPEDGHVSGALVDWLLREAWQSSDPVGLTRALGKRFIEDGIAVFRLNIVIWALHPEHAGIAYVWNRDSDQVEIRRASYDDLVSAGYQTSPIRHVSEGLGGVRQCLKAEKVEFSFPVMAELRAQGGTDYVAMPLPFSNGQIHVMTMASDHPDGFTTANLGLVYECATVISRFYEALSQRANATALLETYLGQGTGARVLGGEIRRGDGDDIDAAILFCDLRNSTGWAERLSRTDYLALLNAFFETVVDLVHDAGGEVLKFVGDGVLAVFPSDANGGHARAAALKAAITIIREVDALRASGADQPLSCSIGLDFGRVTYGNVGSRDRLDFTVIGRPAIIASRLSDLAKIEGHAILATEGIARAADGKLDSIGRHALHNVAEPVEVFAPSSDVFGSRTEDSPEKITA
jgi:class 3 adenylate cyclase/uncharacterized protein (DUF427 family)